MDNLNLFSRILSWSLLVSGLIACEQEPMPMTPQVAAFDSVNLLLNSSFEASIANPDTTMGFVGQEIPRNWTAFVGPTYEAKRTDSLAASETYAVALRCTWTDPAALGYIAQEYEIQSPGKRYQLRARMQLNAVEGRGMSLNIQGFRDTVNCCPDYTFSSEGNATIAGTSSWNTYFLSTPEAIPDDIQTLLIRVDMQRSTTGGALIDDVVLVSSN